MGKLIMWNMVTLDGLFEGKKSWDLDWHNYTWGEELEKLSIEQLKSAEMLLFGRKTYQGMAAYWAGAKGEVADLMNGISKAVFSRTMDRAEWNNTVLIKENVVQKAIELKKKSKRDLFVFGSAELSALFISNGLFDELRLAMNPIVLGEGVPLFKSGTRELRMKLIEAKPLKSGCVILRYQP